MLYLSLPQKGYFISQCQFFFPRSIKIINLDNIYMHNMYNPSAEVTAIDGPLRFEHVTFLNMSLYVLNINFTSIYLHISV